MNEVTKIHLGRQAFTIAADAHIELRKYLHEIKAEVHDSDVVDEVEIRMAELLAEHGVTGDKVIIPADVEFLKSQLGDPKDFTESDKPETERAAGQSRRLFRDTNNAMIAGVAAGLASYFNIDVILIRLIFIVGIFTGGWGILLYLALWIIVPEAKTSSERLQMVGKPVTVTSLKQVVDQADISGAARRANLAIAKPINALFRILLRIVGFAITVVGISLLFGLIASGIYFLSHPGEVIGKDIFPIGVYEHLLVDIGLAVATLMSLLVIIFGISVSRRKWPIRAWATSTLIGLILIGGATMTGLAADTFPTVRDRYNSHFHTSVRQVAPFTAVKVTGNNVRVNYEIASTYSVSLHYYDTPDISTLKTTVTNETLTINSTAFNALRNCKNQSFCIPNSYDMVVTVSSPSPIDISNMPYPPSTYRMGMPFYEN